MSNPAVTVRDRHGNVVTRDDGVIRDGDAIQSRFVMMDGATGGPSASPATLGAAARILGDAFVDGDFRNLSDQAAKHLAVRKRLGAVADGKPAPFLDSAWALLAGTGSTPASAAAPLPTVPAVSADAELQAGRDAAAGAYDTRTRLSADAWKTDEHRAHDRAYADALAAAGEDPRAAWRARAAVQAAAYRRGAP